MAGALTVREAGQFFEGLEADNRRGETGRSVTVYQPSNGVMSLEEGAQALTAFVRSSNVVEMPRSGRQSLKKRGALTLEEAAFELAPLTSKPRRRGKTEGDQSATVEDVLAAERRGNLLAQASMAVDVARSEFVAFQRYINDIAAQFPALHGKNPQEVSAAVVSMAHTDPIGHMQYVAHRENVQQLWPRLHHTIAQAAEIRQAAFNEFALFEDEQFQRKNPDWEPSMGFEVATMLDAAGVSQSELDVLYHTPAQLDLGDPRSLKIMEDAACYHAGKKLVGKTEVWPALIDTFNAVGFSDAEIQAISQGGPISLREHRIQTLLVWAMKWQKQGGDQ